MVRLLPSVMFRGMSISEMLLPAARIRRTSDVYKRQEYAGLREQAQGFDLVQLYEAKQAMRPGKEQEAENRAQQVYGEKYSPLLMFDSKKAVSRMLHEDMERQAVRRMVRQAQKGQQTSQKKKSKKRER